MKIVVIGDSHGNIANLKLVMGFAKKIKAGGIIHCGDWDNLLAAKTVYSYKIPVYGVLGNADIDPKMRKMIKDQAQSAKLRLWLRVNLGGREIGVIHNLTISHQPLTIGLDVVFCGHRHFKSERTVDGVRVVSPGALHSVKPSFAVYDTGTNGVEFFDL